MTGQPKKRTTTSPVTDVDAAPVVGPDDERTSEVIRMYQEGSKLVEITRATGVPRATIYWLLRRNGIATDRLGAGGDMLSAQDLLTRLQQAERENGVLHRQVERLEVLVEYLEAFTAAVRPTNAPARPKSTRART